ncbi:unnamed protein product [Rangifer tarandus platyrhynchus]|uniref:Uncharacterized protein n=1 Tax=Rangifer tarandus platyrhynchus TaxID=3082113 RepID=A0AC59YEJ3_RANTA
MAPPSPAPAVCVQGTFIENALVIWGLEGSQLPVMPTAVCQHRPGGPGLKHGGAVLTSASEGFAGSYASGFVRQDRPRPSPLVLGTVIIKRKAAARSPVFTSLLHRIRAVQVRRPRGFVIHAHFQRGAWARLRGTQTTVF